MKSAASRRKNERGRSPLAGWLVLALVLSSAGIGLASAATGGDPQPSGRDLGDLIETELGRTETTSPVEGAPRKTPASAADSGPIGVATKMSLVAGAVAALVFLLASAVRRSKEKRLSDAIGTNLQVRESVWIGRGQRILLVSFERNKVLVGVSGGALHNLGIFGEGGAAVAPTSPIEREAALREAQDKSTTEFAEFVKGELAGSLVQGVGVNRDRRRKMLSELNSL